MQRSSFCTVNMYTIYSCSPYALLSLSMDFISSRFLFASTVFYSWHIRAFVIPFSKFISCFNLGTHTVDVHECIFYVITCGTLNFQNHHTDNCFLWLELDLNSTKCKALVQLKKYRLRYKYIVETVLTCTYKCIGNYESGSTISLCIAFGRSFDSTQITVGAARYNIEDRNII